MRIFFTLILLLSSQFALSAAILDLACQEVTSAIIVFNSWSTLGDKKAKSLYKFKNGELFLSSPEREEYLYGKVAEIEVGRYQSGYKTIVFPGKNFTVATVSHHDQTSVVISKLQCSKI